jgi:hypothetical protein
MLNNEFFLHDQEIELGVVIESDQARNEWQCAWFAVE